ncbi:hypothetical protein PCANC_05373 [Puccinia coronata f. sp. avenae]|nr:hypothetical protein PCANC_05373 [Puccinia coronata f. sp. avenae]
MQECKNELAAGSHSGSEIPSIVPDLNHPVYIRRAHPSSDRSTRTGGEGLYQPNKELFLGKQVQAGTCLPRNNASASWYKLVPDRWRQQRCPPVKPRSSSTADPKMGPYLKFTDPNPKTSAHRGPYQHPYSMADPKNHGLVPTSRDG